MKNLFLLLIATFVLAGYANAQKGESVLKLSAVKKIFVGELGRTDNADIVREKVKQRLNQTGIFSVVERTNQADAVLIGTVVIEKYFEDGSDCRSSDLKTEAVGFFYLRDAATDKLVWSYEYRPKAFDFAFFAHEAERVYNRVAESVVEKMRKDAGYKDKK
jgi:hypothetical protein